MCSYLASVLTTWGNAFAVRHTPTNSLVGLQMQYDSARQPVPSMGFGVTNVHYTGQGDISDLEDIVVTDTIVNNTLQGDSSLQADKIYHFNIHMDNERFCQCWILLGFWDWSSTNSLCNN